MLRERERWPRQVHNATQGRTERRHGRVVRPHILRAYMRMMGSMKAASHTPRLRWARRGALAAACATLLAGASHAQWGGKGNAVFSSVGIEISVDQRVATLFVMLNDQGYAHETQFGPLPLRLPQFSKARVTAREAIRRRGPSLKAFGEIVAQNPAPVEDYLKAALELGPAPRFDAPADASALAKALSGVFSKWYGREGGAGILAKVSAGEKKAIRAWLAPLNAATEAVTPLVNLGSEEEQLLDDGGPTGRVVVISNPLDAHDALSELTAADTTSIVLGPASDAAQAAMVSKATLAYARTLVHDAVSDAAKGSAVTTAELGDTAKARLASPVALAEHATACALVAIAQKTETCSGSVLDGDAHAQKWVAAIKDRFTKAGGGDTAFVDVSKTLFGPLDAPAPKG